MAHSKTVAILGTGIMGAAMARNLLEAGMHVRAWNRSPKTASRSRTPPPGPPRTPTSC
jgi:3-hydroxyisobutyrate dehydrogenase